MRDIVGSCNGSEKRVPASREGVSIPCVTTGEVVVAIRRGTISVDVNSGVGWVAAGFFGTADSAARAFRARFRLSHICWLIAAEIRESPV